MSDKEIGKVRIGRLVQIMAEIKANYEAQMLIRQTEIEWQTKALAHFISLTVEDDKARDQLTKAASKLAMMDRSAQTQSKVSTPSSADTKTVGMTQDEEIEYIMTHGDESALTKNEGKKGLPF